MACPLSGPTGRSQPPQLDNFALTRGGINALSVAMYESLRYKILERLARPQRLHFGIRPEVESSFGTSTFTPNGIQQIMGVVIGRLAVEPFKPLPWIAGEFRIRF